MRILLDECVPRPLKRQFSGHQVSTVQEKGWTGKKNGELIQMLTADGFDVFLTVDQNLSYQQNLRAAQLILLVLIAPSNRIEDLEPLVPSALNALMSAQPGQLIEINS